MTFRKILVITIAIALVVGILVCLSGCSKTTEFEPADSKIGGLVAIAHTEDFIDGYSYDQTILYDPETLVMYSMISNSNGITITVLYNADGTPKLHSPDKE